MSGVEIIGLILGGLPLVISVAEDYKKGFEPFLKWHRFKREFRTFINSIDLEKRMFDGLLDRLLKYTDLDPEEKLRLLTVPNYDGWSKAETIEALKARLGDSYVSCMFVLETMKEDMCKLQEMMSLKDGSVDWAKPGENRWEYQRKRISHSFRQRGPETATSLERNNRKLRELLDLLDLMIGDEKVNRRKFSPKDTAWAKIFECIRRHAGSLHSALSNGWKCSCNLPHVVALQLQERTTGDWSSEFALTFTSPKSTKCIRKVRITARESNTMDISSPTRPELTPAPEWYLDKLRNNFETKSLPKVSTKLSSFDFGTKLKGYSSMVVPTMRNDNGTELLQVDSYQKMCNSTHKEKVKKTVRINAPSDKDQSNPNNLLADPSIMGQTLNSLPISTRKTSSEDTKIEDLCSTLESFSEDNLSLGYLSDSEYIHHILHPLHNNQLPSQTSKLISLENLLSPSADLKLTRKQRFRLAIILASSLLQLQTTPWLADKMAKSNIFFYTRGEEVLAEQPYICQSFRSAKSSPAATLDDVTNPVKEQLPSLTTTPATTSSRFATRTSLLALGILLLELCFNSPITSQTKLRANYLQPNGQPHNETDFLTARDWVYEVGEEAGLEFENAVKCCVLCSFDVKPNWEDRRFVQGVYEVEVGNEHHG
ncbi:hypothetical protein B7463_g2502, partial [Scytalidium lignicola]